MQVQPQYNQPEPEEEGIDIVALLKGLWVGRKTILIGTGVFIFLGLVAALTMTRTYSVTTVMVPQMASKGNSSLSSLASLAGIDLSSATASGDISPLIYPQIVNSTPFQLELIHTPLHYAKVEEPVSMFDYALEFAKPSVFGVIKKYTIGLPGTILNALRKPKEDLTLPASDGGNSPKPLLVSKDEQKVVNILKNSISLVVDKKEGYLTLQVTGSEPIQTAELAMKVQQLLQDEVTRIRTEKAQSELDYIQARYKEIKAEAESYQTTLATVTDRSQDIATTRSRIERDRIQAKYNIANSIYNEMAKQLEVAKMQVKKDTPVYTIIQPVTVPDKPSNSRAKTLAIWTFLGFILSCGFVLGKGYLPKLKEKFNSVEEEKTKDQ